MTTRKQFRYQDKKQSYFVKGQGTPVVLLHGFGEDETVWEPCMQLSATCKLVVPLLPGTGDSEMIPDMSMEGLASCVKELLDVENGPNEPVIILGHSMGGYITLAFAERYPSLVAGFGLVHSTAFADGEEKRSNREKGIQFITDNGAAAFLKATIPNLYGARTKTESPEKVEQHIERGERFKDEALVAYYRAMLNRPDRTGLLKETTVPVLFVLGREDAAVPLAEGLRQCHLPKLSYIHIHQTAGHMGMVEAPEDTAVVFNKFISFVNGHRP
ncbi:MAG TPA: alpha/beta hydrolase [Flavisolibacter sp.]|jgi:pimeloyl-ACP methyl ester carboxylesterase|nr:alpha/beta hydrolase [Flavisolibacter sp.]